jgi:hypothetical protein
MERWLAGDVILMEAITRRGKLLNVMPQVVVEDNERFLATVSLPGMTFATRDEPGRTSKSLEERLAIYLAPEPTTRDWWERVLHRAVLSIWPAGESHSVRVFWDEDWVLQFWYINIELPYARTSRGIQEFDLYLDVMITPDFAWSWKDEDEFEAMHKAGYFSAEEVAAIRAEGEKVIARLEAREWPFNEPWHEWRPGPSLVAPKIADYWKPDP